MEKSQTKTRSEILTSYSPARKFLSLKKIRHTLCGCGITIALCLLVSSCGAESIWNVSAEELPGLIASGDTSYLVRLNLAEADLSEILELGPGSAFFHAFLARSIGREELYEPLLKTEWQESERAWRLYAGGELCSYYLDTNRYADAEALAAELIGEDDTAAHRRLYLEALYWQERDVEVLEELSRIEILSADDRDNELVLFEAVSAARAAQNREGGIGESGWKQLFLDLFTRQKPSSLHYRAIRFIESGYADAFSEEELIFLNAVVAVADRRYSDAAPALGKLLDEKPVFYLTDETIHAAYTAYRLGGLTKAGAELFDRLVRREEGRSTEKEYYLLCEKTALLYYAAGDYTTAASYFQTAADLAAVPDDTERMRWYLLRATLWVSLDRALELIPSIVSEYSDPSYYSDIFDIVLTRLVGQRRWSALLDFYAEFGDFVDPAIRARAAFLCAALFREDFAAVEDGKKVAPGPDNTGRIAEILYGEATTGGDRYYNLLASSALGVLPETVSILDAPTEYPGDGGFQEEVLHGFISYGLLDDAYGKALQDPGSFDVGTFLMLAAALNEKGDYYRSIRCMDIAKQRVVFFKTREAMELLYPRGFREEIEEAAERDSLPAYLLFALVREESYFNPEIVSHAGAVGLSQLMPATAAETAQRMGIDLPPLIDPGSNVSIGSFYFARMLDRFGVPSNAVFAYNAGPGRMNTWRQIYGGLPEDLLLEAVPIVETQNHGRKVFSSAVVYGYLYYGVSPAEVAEYFFSNTTEGK